MLVPNKIAVELFLAETTFPAAVSSSRLGFQKRSIPNMNSNTTVITTEISTDPRQPKRFENKKKFCLDLATRAQHDLDDPVLFVAELLVHLGRVVEARRVGDNEARIDLAGFDPFRSGWV